MKETIILVAVLAVSVLIAVVSINYIGQDKNSYSCGDGDCYTGEICCEDCGCQGVCDTKTHLCIEQILCGDNICSEDEGCCLDCGCPSGSVCDENTRKCMKRGIKPVCGNGICDFGENVNTCCGDCRFCEPGTFCDETLQMCIVKESGIDNEKAIRQFKIYLLRKGIDNEWIESFEWTAVPDTYEKAPVVKICNIIPDGANVKDFACGRMNADYEVVSYERYF